MGAIVLTVIFGFTRAGWTTSATATDMAATSAQDAVVARLAPICVTQAGADSQWAAQLEEFKTLNSFKRPIFVEDQGWATMPGETTPDRRVATECARQLMVINE